MITVTVTDSANNTGSASITVAYDTAAQNGTGNLQALYTFSEGTGTTTADSSGNGKNGSIQGSVWTTGKNGGGLSFTGTSDYVSVPSMNYDELSISAWFYKNSKTQRIPMRSLVDGNGIQMYSFKRALIFDSTRKLLIHLILYS